MKNIEKKWTLFLVATFVCLFGVVNTLTKGTQALEAPINSHFDDMKFYQCVIDEFNNLNGTTYEYSYNLSDSELSSIENLMCMGDGENVSVKGIEKLIGLKSINLFDWNLSNFNISDIDGLKELYLSGVSSQIDIDLTDKTELLTLKLDDVNFSGLDLSNNKKITELLIVDNYNLFDSVDLSLNDKTELNKLVLSSLNIGTIDLSNNDKIESLDISFSEIEYLGTSTSEIDVDALDLKDKENLVNLFLNGVKFKEIDLSNNLMLENIDIMFNKYYLFKEDSYDFSNLIKFPDTIDTNQFVYEKATNAISFDSLQGLSNIEAVDVGYSFLDVKFEDSIDIRFSFEVEGFSFSKYEILNNKVYLDTNDIKEIKSNMVLNSCDSYDEDCDLDLVIDDNYLKLMHKDVLVKSFEIVYGDDPIEEEDISFDSNLKVDTGKRLVFGLSSGMSIADMRSKITTRGSVSFVDINDQVIDDETRFLRTGDRVKIILSNDEEVIYVISVSGDANGDGLINTDDVLKIAKSLIKTNDITSKEFVSAADMNEDGRISLNDVIILAKRIVNGSGI